MSEEKILLEMEEMMKLVKDETKALQELLTVIEEEIKAEAQSPPNQENRLDADEDLSLRLQVKWGRMNN